MNTDWMHGDKYIASEHSGLKDGCLLCGRLEHGWMAMKYNKATGERRHVCRYCIVRHAGIKSEEELNHFSIYPFLDDLVTIIFEKKPLMLFCL